MGKLLFVFIALIIILLIFWQKNKNIGNINTATRYRNLTLIVFIAGILLFLATSGKFVVPQLLQLIKLVIPLFTKLIGI